MEKDGACKMDTQNAALLETLGEGIIMLELIKRRKRNWLGYWLIRNCQLKDALEGRVKVRGRRRYQMTNQVLLSTSALHNSSLQNIS